METCHVLIVDDDPDFREGMYNNLHQQGVCCEAAPDGDTALELIRHGQYELILLDIHMPGKNGLETLQAIKDFDPLIGVILLTGKASVSSGFDGIRFGADDYLMKPVAIDFLLARMQAALRRRKKRQQDHKEQRHKMALPG